MSQLARTIRNIFVFKQSLLACCSQEKYTPEEPCLISKRLVGRILLLGLGLLSDSNE